MNRRVVCAAMHRLYGAECSFNEGDTWYDLFAHPQWIDDYEYRRKKQYISINGRQVPKPLDIKPDHGQTYYYPQLLGR